MLKQNFEYKKQQYKKFEAQMARKLREREREIEIDFMHRMATQEAKFQELLVRQRCEAQTELSRLKRKRIAGNHKKDWNRQQRRDNQRNNGKMVLLSEKQISSHIPGNGKILAKDKGYKKSTASGMRLAFIASPFLYYY